MLSDSKQIPGSEIKKLLNDHDFTCQDTFDDFYDCFGHRLTYQLADVLNWLGY